MEIGFGELIIILVVAAAVLITLRLSAPKSTGRSSRALMPAEVRDRAILKNRRNGMRWAGIGLLVIGLLLVMSVPSLIRAIFLSYAWGFLLIVLGAVFLLLPRRSK